MRRFLDQKLIAICFIVAVSGWQAQGSDLSDDINDARAKFNYQMFCQGCHTPDGTGINDTPQIKDHLGYFLSTQKGREYLVQVPGSANSALDSQQLAELLNWIIIEFGGNSVPENMQFYTTKEVSSLRKTPLFEVANYRKQLISELPINN